MEMTCTAKTFIGSGIVIMISGIIYSLIIKQPALFLYGWGCCDIFIGIYHRKEDFYKVKK